MANNQEYVTVIKLNDSEAKNNLEALRKKIDDLTAARDKAIAAKGDTSFIKQLSTEIKAAKAELKAYESGVSKTIETINNLSTATVGDIEKAVRALNKQMKATSDPEDYKRLSSMIDLCKERLEEMKNSATTTEAELQKLVASGELVKQVMADINNASVASLKGAQQSIEQRMAGMNPNSAAYKEQNEDLLKIKARLQEIADKQKIVNTIIDEYNADLRKAGLEVKTVADGTALVNRTIANLDKASIKDIETSLKVINDQMKHMDRGTAEFKEMTQQAKKLRIQLEEIRKEGNAQESWISRLGGWFNKMQTLMFSSIAAVTGLQMTVRKSINDFASMEEEMANVRKYTGLSKEGVDDLNESLKKIDTRTSREELNQLAGAAGRLGITAKEDILEFVDAADKINVALGDDLGEGAVDVIGKLAVMFGEDKEKGLRGAMLATGSALNEIAQNSSAAAGEVVDFLSKVGGVGNMAKFTQAQLMGLGSALSQNQQEMATSSTVISQLVTKMFQDTARYATVAGQDVEEFTELLNTDANAALMKFLSAMQERGGFADMAPMFQEMNLNGTRAVGVLSTLAAHLDEVTEAQQLATEAYEEGTSVIDEFNTMNETVQAQIEKAQKHFHELSVELGEKLLPVGKYAISAGSVMVKLLSSLVTFVNNYKAVLVGLGVALVALNAKQLVHIATTKTQIFVNETLITTFKKLKVAIMSNPWGVAIAAVTMLATAIYDLVSNMNEAKKSITALQQANKEATAEYSKQEGKIKTLSERVHDNTIALSERKKALKELKEIVPDYLADLTSEGELINDNTKALDAYCESLLQTMKLKKYQEKLEEKAGEVADKELERREKEKELQEAHDKTEETKNKQGANAESSVFSYTGGNLSYNKEVTDAENREKALSNEIKTLNEEIDKGKQEYQELYDSYKSLQPKESEGEKPKPDKPEPKTETGGGSTKDELKERENEVKQANERMQIENILAYRSGEKTYSEYQDTLNTLTQQGYDERKKIYEDANATERAEYTKLLKEESDWQESQRTDDVKRSKEYYQREKNERDAYLKAAFYDQTSEIYQNEDALNEALFQCDMEYQRKLLSLMKEGTQEWENQVYDIEQKEKNRQTQLQIDYYNKVQDLREDYNLASAKEMEKAELDALEALYRSKMNKGLLSEEEYQKARLAIVKKYAGQEADESTKGQASSALETAKQKVGEKKQSSGNDLVSSMAGIFKEVEYRKQVNEELEKLYQANAISYETYQEAIKQNSKETWNDVLSAATLALSSISSLLGAASSYAQACSDLETNKITADYDKQIEAAGNNSKKKEKLEKERDEKIKEAKTKANKRAMEIEIAQAMASTAAAAINAYASASKESWHLGPIAAAAAVAAGMLQIATIKKQHEAEEAGYYEGGFTGGTQFRKKAGIVHEGEFVANHEAVANANILPALQLIDRAQRNNTVGSLTSEDVSRTLGQNNTTVVSAPTVNVMTDNEELNGALTQLNQSMQQLNLVLGGNIRAVVSIDGDDGVAKNLERYNRMKNRV